MYAHDSSVGLRGNVDSREHTGGVDQLPLASQVVVADPESVYPLTQL